MPAKLWSSLSAEDQQIVQEAVTKQTLKSMDLGEEEEEGYLTQFEEMGVEVIRPTDEEIAVMASASRKQVWPKLEELLTKEVVDKMLAAVGG